MQTIMRVLFFSLSLGFSSQQAWSHGCPVQPDESMIFDMGVDAQLFWQYGPDMGDQSVLFVELKRPGTAVPTSESFLPEVSLESADGTLVSSAQIDPVFNEAGQMKNGEFRISNLQFSAVGSWKMHLKLKDAAGYEEVQSIVIEICAL